MDVDESSQEQLEKYGKRGTQLEGTPLSTSSRPKRKNLQELQDQPKVFVSFLLIINVLNFLLVCFFRGILDLK